MARSKYRIYITKPNIPGEKNETLEVKWRVHTRDYLTGSDTHEEKSATHTWKQYESEKVILGPYELEVPKPNEIVWVEMLEPEKPQHIWPTPIWYVTPGE